MWVFCRLGARFFPALRPVCPCIPYNGFMKPETAILWWQLNLLTKRRYDLLLQAFGSLDDALANVSVPMLRELGCREETIPAVFARLAEYDAARYGKEMERHAVRLLSIEDDAYPAALRTVDDPPVFLSYRGDLSVLAQPLVSVVGTRDMSSYGKRVAGDFVARFARAGVVTVSGLALGIDAEVARETLDAGGRTVAVLGGGLSTIYPKEHETLAENVVDGGGLLLSEFPLGMEPGKFTFPSRNRIIAALGLGTVVIEAAEKSGAIITAELALDYNRSVFAVPGPVFEPRSAGCNLLIGRGEARLVASADEVLREIGIIASLRAEPISFDPSSPMEESVWNSLTGMPQAMDDLVEKTGFAAGDISATLTLLELQGVVKNVGGGQWAKG